MSSQERFGYEWNKYRAVEENYEQQFWKWVHPLTKEFFYGKSVLDAGCGMGRNAYWCLQAGASRLVAFDFDQRSVDAARETLAPFPQAEVRFTDIENFHFNELFDVAFSIGVIHHLAHPERALRLMAQHLKPGGTLLIWVYGYEGNEWLVRYIDPIRKYVTSRLSPNLTHAISYIFSLPLYLYVKLFPQRRAYLKQLKQFGWRHIHSIVFDQLLPTIANYWRRNEVEALLRDIPELEDIRLYSVNNLSWTAVCRRRR